MEHKHEHQQAVEQDHRHSHHEHPEPETELEHAASEGHSSRHHESHGVDHSGHELMFRNRFWVSLVLTIPVLAFSPMLQEWFGFRIPDFPGAGWAGPIFAVIIFFYGGWPFLDMAVPELKNRRPGMMTLISLAISVAFLYSLAALIFFPGEGFFWEMATLIDVMLLGHWMEMRSVRQASGALNELAKLMPDTAERINESGATETVSVSGLVEDDRVLVRPGGSIPADGVIEEGSSAINESMITGESKPVKKGPADAVIAGTINGDGSLRIRVTATGDKTALAGIMRLVAEAQAGKTQTQVLADKAAGWLFYVALAVAILTGVLWTFAIGFQSVVLQRVVTVLVIACPHALGLAIPLVVAISTALGAKNGILVRDRVALESARLLDYVIFDKTGTLTRGEFGVVSIQTAAGFSETDALAVAAAAEGDSEHLIAAAIRRAAQERGLPLPAVTAFEAVKGKGIVATVNGQTVKIGGPRLLEMLAIKEEGSFKTFSESAGRKAQSVIYLIKDEQIQAAFALADVVREESRLAVRKLTEMGIEVAMLTGDSRAVAEAVAEELGITTVFAEVLPEHKDQKVAELQKGGRKVAMVGDGVNDAPALTRADVGIAIGGGTDVAIESAGIILVQSNPLDVVKIVHLSRKTYAKMIQNLIWATGYNIIAIPLAAGILAPIGFFLSPAVGAVLMSVSTVVVAINAQFLRGEHANLQAMTVG